jgi:hypothetical protein
MADSKPTPKKWNLTGELAPTSVGEQNTKPQRKWNLNAEFATTSAADEIEQQSDFKRVLASLHPWKWKPDTWVAVFTLIISVVALWFSGHTFKVTEKESQEYQRQQMELTRTAQLQQKLVTQGNVMSQCIDEYNHIIHDTIMNWPQTNTTRAESIRKEYSDRLYALHFQEYHLFFHEDLLPKHIYTVWLKKLRHDANPTDFTYNTNYLPTLDVSVFTNRSEDRDQDFGKFIGRVLCTTDAITNIVSQELDKPAPED